MALDKFPIDFFGRKVELPKQPEGSDCDCRRNLLAGDIYTSADRYSVLYGEVARLAGTGLSCSGSEEAWARIFSNPDLSWLPVADKVGLILMRRPGFLFQTGDELAISRLKGQKEKWMARVISIDKTPNMAFVAGEHYFLASDSDLPSDFSLSAIPLKINGLAWNKEQVWLSCVPKTLPWPEESKSQKGQKLFWISIVRINKRPGDEDPKPVFALNRSRGEKINAGNPTLTFPEKVLAASGLNLEEVAMADIFQPKTQPNSPNGEFLHVNTEASLWGFQTDDVIASTDSQSPLFAKVATIQGTLGGKILFGIVLEKDYAEPFLSPRGLVLVSRPALRFKLQESVKAIHGDSRGLEGFVAAINPETGLYLIEFPGWEGGHSGNFKEDYPWIPLVPSDFASQDKRNRFWMKEEWLTPKSQSPQPQAEKRQKKGAEKVQPPKVADPSQPKAAKGDKPAAKPITEKEMPQWMMDLKVRAEAEVSHFFVIHGNIRDHFGNGDGQKIALAPYLEESFGECELRMKYSISQGLRFTDPRMAYLYMTLLESQTPKAPQKERRDSDGSGAGLDEGRQRKADQGHCACDGSGPNPEDAEKEAREGKTKIPISLQTADPQYVLPELELVLLEKNNGTKKILIIEEAQDVVPNIVGVNGSDIKEKIIVETLLRWALDDKFKNAGSIILLITPKLEAINESLRSSDSGVEVIRIPRALEKERLVFWENSLAENGVGLVEGIDTGILARISSGLSGRQIRRLCSLAKSMKCSMGPDLLKEHKRQILESEFGDRLNVVLSDWGFEHFGGKEELKKYFLDIRDWIFKGQLRRVPMGILAAGPPGTGKTFFFHCFAGECGMNSVEILNPRSMWVGQSEEIFSSMLNIIDDLAPVVVLEDEADQSETSRDGYSGDSGVSNHLRQMKFRFCSDPKRRGKVIWVRISNRPDLIDAAYKRRGRSDDIIPFLLPTAEDYEGIFRIMFARYQIPTSITDFASYAKEVAKKVYCTGSDIESIVREADIYAGGEGLESVGSGHLERAISDWELPFDSVEIDRQQIICLTGSSKRLRPKGWEETLEEARKRLAARVVMR